MQKILFFVVRKTQKYNIRSEMASVNCVNEIRCYYEKTYEQIIKIDDFSTWSASKIPIFKTPIFDIEETKW